MLNRYVALVRARRDLSTLDLTAFSGMERRRIRQKWAPLPNIYVPPRRTLDGSTTLDGTLDLMAYQLFRDDLLPMEIRGGTKLRQRYPTLSQLEERSAELQREALHDLESTVENDMKQQTGDLRVRRSIAQTALVIGCDEAGRGPLAGPVVGAAVARIPVTALQNPFNPTPSSLPLELFPVLDSKRMSDEQRNASFLRLTGVPDVFSALNSRSVVTTLLPVSPAGTQPAVATASSAVQRRSTKRAQQLDALQGCVLADDSAMLCLRGSHADSSYRYCWSIAVANHKYIDDKNIFAASMTCMSEAARAVWTEMELVDRDTLSIVHRPSITTKLFHRFVDLAPQDDEDPLLQQSQRLNDARDDVFGAQVRQPPLVLVDGAHVPQEASDFFGDVDIGGAVHHIVQGDGRSWSIAAASILAKASRDSIMDFLHMRYPQFGFNSNRGYPVRNHVKVIQKHGLSPVHRLSYRPCADAQSKQAIKTTVRRTQRARQ